MWQPTTAWSLILIPSPCRLDSLQNCLLSSLGQNYCFFHSQAATHCGSPFGCQTHEKSRGSFRWYIYFLSRLGDISLKRAELFADTAKVSWNCQDRHLKNYMAPDRKNKFSVGTGQSKSLFIPYFRPSIKDRSRIMSCDCKSRVRERCSNVSFQSWESEWEGHLSYAFSGRKLLPPAAPSSPHSSSWSELAGSALVSRPPEKGESPLYLLIHRKGAGWALQCGETNAISN